MRSPPKYTVKRPNSDYYAFQLNIPARYQHLENGKSKIFESMRIKDWREAEIEAGRRRAEYFNKWKAASCDVDIPSPLEKKFVPSEMDIQIFVTEIGYDAFEDRLSSLETRESSRSSIETWKEHIAHCERMLLNLTRQTKEQSRETFRPYVHNKVKKRNWDIDENSVEFDEIIDRIVEAVKEALRIRIMRDKGNASAMPTIPAVLEGQALRNNKAKEGETIHELFGKYTNIRLLEKRKSEGNIAQDLKVINDFTDLVGKNIAISAITTTHVREWRDLLIKCPANRNKLNKYKNLTLSQVVSKSSASNDKILKPVTVNRHLSALSSFLAWCHKEGYHNSDPCKGLFLDTKNIKERRPPFRTDELNDILYSPLFTGFKSNAKLHHVGKMTANDWRFWIPILCLFTGARIGEISQLLIRHQKKTDENIYFLEFEHAPEENLKTKSKTTRPMAIHSILIKIGFLEFVDDRLEQEKDNADKPLFPEIYAKQKDGADIGAHPSRWWRRYLTRIGVKNGADGLGSHSFRHALADQLREANYLDDEIAIALGHKFTSTTGGYGSKMQGTVKRQSEMIENAKFKGVKFEKWMALRNKVTNNTVSKST